MNGKDLFNAIGDISDDLILEASNPAKKMRRVRMSRAAVIAAAVIMLFGITVYAASVIYGGISGHSSNIPTYYSVPTREALGRDIGIELNVVDVFSSGCLSTRSGFLKPFSFLTSCDSGFPCTVITSSEIALKTKTAAKHKASLL